MKPFFTLLGTMLLVSSTLRATPPDWSITEGHQNAMVVYATVVDASGNAMTNAGSLLSVTEYGVMVGSTPISIGPKGPVFQMKVGSDQWQSDLTYSFYDGKTDTILTIGPGPGFVAGSTLGTITDPIVLSINR
jgi:hypothetical protein